MKGITVISHPLVQHYLTRLRDRQIGPQDFRRILQHITVLLVFEATASLVTRPVPVNTPLAKARGARLKHDVLLVPILRAGLGMLEPALKLIPDARAGFIGAKRDAETLAPSVYHESLPADLRRHDVIVLDPMLATGGSTVAAIDLLKERHAKSLRSLHLVAAPEGLRHLRTSHPEVQLFTAAIDRRLNRKGYIVPGLCDAGDRLFGV